MLKAPLARFSEPIYGLFRIFFGILFAFHGAQKLLGLFGGQMQPVGTQPWARRRHRARRRHPDRRRATWRAPRRSSPAVRWPAAYFLAHAPNGTWPIENGGELAILYCFAFLFIAARGSADASAWTGPRAADRLQTLGAPQRAAPKRSGDRGAPRATGVEGSPGGEALTVLVGGRVDTRRCAICGARIRGDPDRWRFPRNNPRRFRPPPRRRTIPCGRSSAGSTSSSYKATIKGLTQFGDRRQGTDRNRAAIDWIEAQLKSYGCTNTERLKYDYQPAPTDRRARTRPRRPRRGGLPRGHPRPDRRQQRSDAPAGREAARAEHAAVDTRTARAGLLHEDRHDAPERDVHRRRRTWTASATAKPPTTTARARRS